MNKLDPLTKLDPSIIGRHRKACDQLYSVENECTARIDYIMNFIFKAFNKKLGAWEYNGNSSQSSGSFESDMFEDQFTVWSSPELPNEGLFLDKDGGEWGLYDGIPSRWLFEDFEDELTNGIVNLQKRNADKKLQAAKRAVVKAEEEKALIESIKEKLTPAELKALLKKKNQKTLK